MPMATIPLVGKYGLIKDKPPQELALNAWSDAMNIRFRDDCVERCGGEQQLFATPAVTPYFIQQYNQGSNRWWVWCGNNKVYADNGVTRQDVTPSSAPTGGVDDRWTGGTLNGINVINNGVNLPAYWDGGAGVFLPLTGLGTLTKAASVRPFGNFLVALDITEGATRYPHMIRWSHPAVPGSVPTSWDYTNLALLAGREELAEEPSFMVDQLPLGNANIIYKENAMFSMVATGDANVFRFQRLPGEVGALARGCIADTPKGHVVLVPGDVIIHNGQGPQSILTGTMRQWLFKTIDSTNRKRSFVVSNPPTREVWICFPELGKSSCTLALVWNWDTGTCSLRQLRSVTYGATGQLDSSSVATWSGQTGTWSDASGAWNEDQLSPAQRRLVTTGEAPIINAVDVTYTNNGSTYTSYVERKGIALDSQAFVKWVNAVLPRVSAAIGTRLQIEVGGQMDVESPVVWGTPFTYTVGSTYKADVSASGRFLALRITSLDNQQWSITSMDLAYELMGEY